MIVLPGSDSSTDVSRFDCAVSIEIWSTAAPASSGRNEYPEGRSWMIAAYPKQRCTAVVPVTPSTARASAVEAVLPGLVRAGLHVRLVDLHDVGTGGEEVEDLLVDGRGVVEGELALVVVVSRSAPAATS